MSLPRQLKNTFRAFIVEATQAELFVFGMHAGIKGSYHSQLPHKILKAADSAGLSLQQQAQAAMKWTWRHMHSTRVTSIDDLTRIKAKLFIALYHSPHDCETAEFRDVEVPRYFLKRLKKENAQREKRDRDAIDLLEQISFFRKHVYSSRTFPVKLRAIIFDRDNYTCRCAFAIEQSCKMRGST